MFHFYFRDAVFSEAVEESTAKALNALSTSMAEGVHTEVIFDPDCISIAYTIKMPALLKDAESSAFRADEVRKVTDALRVLFKPVSEEWTRYKVTDKERGFDKCRSRVIHLGTGKGNKLVYINLWY